MLDRQQSKTVVLYVLFKLERSTIGLSSDESLFGTRNMWERTTPIVAGHGIRIPRFIIFEMANLICAFCGR